MDRLQSGSHMPCSIITTTAENSAWQSSGSGTVPRTRALARQRIHQRPGSGQPLDRQSVPERFRAAVGPLPRQGHTPRGTIRTDEDHCSRPSFREQNLHPLAHQRMERMRDHEKTQRFFGLCGPMQ